MEPSKTKQSESPSNHGEARPNVQGRLTETPPGTIRALLGVEAASFLLAATIHAGGLISGYGHQEAMIAESVIGAVLLGGLVVSWIRPRSIFSVAVGVQAFALLGTLVGVWTIIVGIGPRTIPDIVYHVAIVLVLTIGIRMAWRSRGTESA